MGQTNRPTVKQWLMDHRSEYTCRADAINECSRILEVHKRTARRLMKKIEDEFQSYDEFSNNDPIINIDEAKGLADMILISKVPKTPEELAEIIGLDMKIWTITKNICNFWGNSNNPNYQIKIWCKREVSELQENFLESVLEQMKEFTPVYSPIVYPKLPEGNMLEMALYDPHIGGQAWRKESGDDYDLKIALNRLEDAADQILSYARVFPISLILFPIGNDWFNVNSSLNETAKGTPQDEDSRTQKVYEKAFDSMIRILDKCRTIAPVKVISVPGNHDKDRIQFFAHSLKSWYRTCDEVVVDCGPEPFKFHVFGKNLIGYNHGSDIKQANLPLLMATEVPKLWSDTNIWEWHTGHLHKKATSIYIPMDEFNGVRVRILPSLVGRNAWHMLKGFRSMKSAVGLVWHSTQGNIAEYSFNVQ